MPDDKNIFDENMSHLLRHAGEPPRLDPERKQQMLDQLKQQFEQAPAAAPKGRSLMFRLTRIASCAAAAAAVIALAWFVFSPAEPKLEKWNETSEIATTKRLDDGTVLYLKGKAKYALVANRHIRVDSGQVLLFVAKASKPFIVDTPHGRAEAKGTKFTVAAEADTTFVAVGQGRVDVSNNAGTVQVGAGQQAQMDAKARPRRGAAPRFTHLINWAREELAGEDPFQAERAEGEQPQGGQLQAVDPQGQKVRLELRNYHVDVVIENGIARTTIDQTFFNQLPWQIEGTFYFPLPPDASLSRLAMYVQGTLNEGGMVERQYGRMVYESIVYRRRDPALLEMMEGNVFKMRVFPIFGRQEKRIIISYTQTLPELYNTLRYWLPMEHANDEAKKLSISVRVKGGAGKAEAASSTHAIATRDDGKDMLIEYSEDNIAPDQDFLLHLTPTAGQPWSPLCATVMQDGKRFLFVKVRPKAPGEAAAPQARQWIVINDVSASRSSVDIKAQVFILRRLLAEADDDDTFALINVDTQARTWRDELTGVRDPAASGGAAFATVTDPMGATNIAAAFKEAGEIITRSGATNPYIVYLGDGVATDSETASNRLVAAMPPKATFVGIGVGKKVDATFLQAAADKSGGLFTTINPSEDIIWRAFDMVAALNTARLVDIETVFTDAGGGVLDVEAHPSTGTLSDGEALTVLVRTDGTMPARMVLKARAGGQDITETYDLMPPVEGADYAPRLWAAARINHLLRDSAEEHKKEIIALSKAYYVVTPFTSLIVLENEADYKKWKVETGRKDHWQLYPAPKKIKVIREPLKNNYWQGPGAPPMKGKAGHPKSIDEIVESVQFRVVTPLYGYYQHQRRRMERFGLYGLISGRPQAAGWGGMGMLPAMPTPETSQLVDTGGGVSLEGIIALPGLNSGWRGEARGLMGVRSRGFGRDLNGRFWAGGPGGGGGGGIGGPWALDELDVLSGSGSLEFRTRWSPLTINGGTVTVSTSGMININSADASVLAYLGTGTFPMTGMSGDIKGQVAANATSIGGTFLDDIQVDFMLKATERYYESNGLIAHNLTLLSGGNTFLGTTFRTGDFNNDGAVDVSGRTTWDRGWMYRPSSGLILAGEGKGKGDAMDLYRIEHSGSIDGKQLQAFGQASFRRRLGDRERIEKYNARYGGSHYSWAGSWDDGRRMLAIDGLARDFGEMVVTTSNWELQRQTDPTPSAVAAPITRPPPVRTVMKFISVGGEYLPPMMLGAHTRAMGSVGGSLATWTADRILPAREDIAAMDASEGRDGVLKAIDAFVAKQAKTSAATEETGIFWSHQGWNTTPTRWDFVQPQVHGWGWGRNMVDLTRYAPALQSSWADVGDEVVGAFGKSPVGKVSDQAAARIAAARKNTPTMDIAYVTKKGKTVFKLQAGPEDRFALTGRTSMYLRQDVVCDGKSLYHVYPELGLSARRPAARRVAGLRRLAPHLLPPASELARVWNVALEATDGKLTTIRLTPAVLKKVHEGKSKDKGKGTDAPAPPKPAVLVTFDDRGFVTQTLWQINAKTKLTQTVTHADSKITMTWQGEKGKPVEASYNCTIVTPTASPFAPPSADTVVLDMPLRRPEHYKALLAELGDDPKHADEQLRLRRHLAMTQMQDYSWQNPWGQAANAWQTMVTGLQTRAKAIDKIVTPGDMTIMSSAGYAGSIRNHFKGYAMPAAGPLEKYWLGMGVVKTLGDLSQAGRGGFVGHLAKYGQIVHTGGKARVAVTRELMKDYPASPLLYAAAIHTGGQDHSIWLDLAKMPRWRGLALYTGAQYAQSDAVAEAFDAYHKDLMERGWEVPISSQLAAALKRDKARWDRVMGRWAAAAAKSDNPGALLRLAEFAWVYGDKPLAAMTMASAEKLVSKDAPLTWRLAKAQALWAMGRPKEALVDQQAVLDGLKAKGLTPSPALLASSARLAQQAGDPGKAVDYELAAILAERPYMPKRINVNLFRQRYQWLWGQLTARVKQHASAARAKDAPAEAKQALADSLAQAVEVWKTWSSTDDKNSANLHQQLAALYREAGDTEEAWRVISTVIDQKPKDGASYSHVGGWYQGAGDNVQAQQWYAKAYAVEPTNGDWIWKRAELLRSMGRKDEAQKLYKEIANKKWQPRFEHYNRQAAGRLK